MKRHYDGPMPDKHYEMFYNAVIPVVRKHFGQERHPYSDERYRAMERERRSLLKRRFHERLVGHTNVGISMRVTQIGRQLRALRDNYWATMKRMWVT